MWIVGSFIIMDSEQEPDPEIPQARPIPKPPMRVGTANRWITLLTDYLDVGQAAAKQEAYTEANRKFDPGFSGEQ